MNEFGFSEEVMHELFDIFLQIPDLEKVILFGSRATGRYKRTSDVDIAVMGCSLRSIYVLKDMLEDSNIIYFFDVVDYHNTTNELRDEIDLEGKLLYLRDRETTT